MSASAIDRISLSLVQNKRLEDSANLPDPDIIAAEIDSQISLCSPMSAVPTTSIVEDLQAALAQFETRSLPTLAHCFPRSFTFYVPHPIRSIRRNRRRFETVDIHGKGRSTTQG